MYGAKCPVSTNVVWFLKIGGIGVWLRFLRQICFVVLPLLSFVNLRYQAWQENKVQRQTMPYPLLLASQRHILSASRQHSRNGIGRYFSTRPNEIETFLNGTSSLYAEQMFEQYEEDPSSVHPSWKRYFDNLQQGVSFHQDDYSIPTMVPGKRMVAQAAVSLFFFFKSSCQRKNVMSATFSFMIFLVLHK